MKSPIQALAKRFWANEIWTRLEGRRVQFVRDVDREEFTVPAGAAGVIMSPFLGPTGLIVAVKLDGPPPGAQAYEGEVHWAENVNLDEVENDIELL